MTTLKLTKSIDLTGNKYYTKKDVYEIEDYQVEVLYNKEHICNISIIANRNKMFIPYIYYNPIYLNEDWTEIKREFVIDTTAYGSLKPNEIKQVIDGYEKAIKVVEILTNTFNRKD